MDTATSTTSGVEISYATSHQATHGHRVLAGAAILLGGLVLAVVGGCFLIGVMMISTHGFNTGAAGTPLTTPATVLVFVLYALAGASFIGATLIMLAGLRGLFKVLRG